MFGEPTKMKSVLGSCAVLLGALTLAPPARATTMYVSPTGTATTGCTTRANPCSLGSAAAAAVAGDTVVLMDGVYKETLAPQNSGTASAWISFQADECATPIIEGQGVGPDMDDPNGVGVYSATAEYIRFVGLVSRGETSEFTALGDPINVTAHLVAQARVGEVLVSERAATVAGLASDGRERRHLVLKGSPVDAIVIAAGNGAHPAEEPEPEATA